MSLYKLVRRSDGVKLAKGNVAERLRQLGEAMGCECDVLETSATDRLEEAQVVEAHKVQAILAGIHGRSPRAAMHRRKVAMGER
jgi:hypothetical protein